MSRFNPTIGTIPLSAFAVQPTMAEIGDYLSRQSPERIADAFDWMLNGLQCHVGGDIVTRCLRPIADAIKDRAVASGCEGDDIVSMLAELMGRIDA